MKNRIAILTALVVGVMPLSSCNSFNQTTYTEQYTLTQETTTIQRRGGVTHVTETCPVYTLPILPSTPALPLKELDKISPTDRDALDRLQRKHIEDLRLHISKVNSLIVHSHREYVLACKEFLAKQKPQ